MAVLALTALPASLTEGPDAEGFAGRSGAHAGTWEDDCNLSRRTALLFAAQPGSTKTAAWTRTAISYHGRGCRQVAAVAPWPDAAPAGRVEGDTAPADPA